MIAKRSKSRCENAGGKITQSFKFLLVGVVNTLIGTGTMFSLYNLAHCSYWVSSAANYIVGGIVSFFLNKYFTFQSKTREWSQAGSLPST